MGGCSTAPNRWHPVGLSPGHPQAGQPRPCGRNMDGPPRPLSRLEIWGVSPPQPCASPRSPGCRVQSTTSQMLVREPRGGGPGGSGCTPHPAACPHPQAACHLFSLAQAGALCAPFCHPPVTSKASLTWGQMDSVPGKGSWCRQPSTCIAALPLFPGPRRLNGVCAAHVSGLVHPALGLECGIPLGELQTPSLEGQFPGPPPQGRAFCQLRTGTCRRHGHGGHAAWGQEAPCPRAGLVAVLTVSTLPVVSSMELARMASRLRSACVSSSPTMPL